MKKVTFIEFRKNKSIRIIFDNKIKFTISEDAYMQMPLKSDDTLTVEQWKEFEEIILFDQCFQKALNYIKTMPHSTGLLKRKLNQKRTFNKKIIDLVIEKLKQLEYLNDENFCQLFIEQKCHNNDWAEYRIRLKLAEYGIERQLINQAMQTHYISPQEELKKVQKAFEKKWKSFTKKESFLTKKTKTINFLYRKGFDRQMIQQVTQEKLIDRESHNDFSSY